MEQRGRDKMDAISQAAVCSQRSNLQYSSIGSDNGLVPSRRQAIIRTNGG